VGWKPEVLVQGTWSRNGLVFATEEEAKQNAFDLSMRWTLCMDSRAVEVDEAPNYKYVDGQLVRLVTDTEGDKA
jgi:hypothetical protein